MIPAKIFREYDIRGVVGKDIDESFARVLGQAYAMFCQKELGRSDLTVGLGYDCRLSNIALSTAFIDGVTSTGVNVVNGQLSATPQLYFLVFHRNLDGGVQVTASHNPSDQNGFKMMVGKRTMSGADIQQSLRVLVDDIVSGKIVPPSGRGEVELYDAESAYLKDLIARCLPHIGKRKLKVVVDGGNGVGGPVGVPLLRALGCEVIELFTDPDGRFPNHHPDPTDPKNIPEMIARVKSERADVGIGWDGDADRLAIVDETGTPILGDMLLCIFGRALLKEIPHPTIVAEVKCSEAMYRDLRSRGANAVMWKTGHSLIKGKLRELNAELAGEMSGHIFFNHRYFGYDDGIYASARLVEILSLTDKKCSELLDGVPKMYSTPELRTDCPEEIKFEVATRAQKLFPEYETIAIDGVRVTFPRGWALVRASNTQAVLSTRFEAETPEDLQEYRTLFEGRIEKLKADLLREHAAAK